MNVFKFKKLALALGLCMAVGLAQAQAVVLITDPVPAGTVQCGFYIDAPSATVPTGKLPVVTLNAAQAAQYSMPVGSVVCLLDINAITVGAHTAQVTGFSADPIWGESAKSAPALNFTRPVATSAPTVLRVTR